MGYHALLRGIFPMKRLNPGLFCLLQWQVGSSPLAPPGKPLALFTEYGKNKRVHKWINGSKIVECIYSEEGNGNPLQYSCLGNPIDKRTCQATVHGVARVGQNLVINHHVHNGILFSLRKEVIPVIYDNMDEGILLNK